MIAEEQTTTTQSDAEVQAPFDTAAHVNRLCGNLFTNQIVEINRVPVRILKPFNVYEEMNQLKDSYKAQGAYFTEENNFIDWLVLKGDAVQVSNEATDVSASYRTFPLCPTSRQIHSAALLLNVNVGDEGIKDFDQLDIWLYALTSDLRRFMIHDETTSYAQRIRNTCELMANVIQVLENIWKIDYVTNPDLEILSQVRVSDRPVTDFFKF